MKTLLYIASFFFLLGCQSGPKPEISLLEGYWEIEHVQTPQGKQKEFGPNILVDYFQLKDGSGSRSKMQPQLDGSFISKPTTETFRVVDSAGSWYLFYTTPYDSWEERLEELTQDKLVLEVPSGSTYHYKRYQPIDLRD